MATIIAMTTGPIDAAKRATIALTESAAEPASPNPTQHRGHIDRRDQLIGSAPAAEVIESGGPKAWELEAALFKGAVERENPEHTLLPVEVSDQTIRCTVAGKIHEQTFTPPPGLRFIPCGPNALQVLDDRGGRFFTDWTTQHARVAKGTASAFVYVIDNGGQPEFRAYQVIQHGVSTRLVNDLIGRNAQELVDKIFEFSLQPGDLASSTMRVTLNDGRKLLVNGPDRNGELELTATQITCRLFYDPVTHKVRFPHGAHLNWYDPQIVSGSVLEGRLVVSSFANAYATKPGDPRETTTMVLTPSNKVDHAYVARSQREA